MVHGVVVWRQCQIQPLQQVDPARAHVEMRPLVELVGEEDPEGDGEDRRRSEDVQRIVEREQRSADGRTDGDEAVVPVRLDEVVPGDLLLVDVVLAKRSDQRLPDHRHVGRAPGVGSPVHDAGDEVGQHEAEWLNDLDDALVHVERVRSEGPRTF